MWGAPNYFYYNTSGGSWELIVVHLVQILLHDSSEGLNASFSTGTQSIVGLIYRGADKSLARPGRKQATATEVFEFHVSYL
jgi:hypothetical protein